MRRKLIEQLHTPPCLLTKLPAGLTTAVVSTIIDRDGYLSARLAGQCMTMTVADTNTQNITVHVYDSDCVTGTFTIFDSANATFGITGTYSASETGADSFDGVDVDLLGADRYIRVYLSVTGATTVTAMVSVTCILGDAITEPAV